VDRIVIVEEKSDNTLVFRFLGTITGIDTIDIIKIVEDSEHHAYKHIVIDLNKVTFIDSNALGGFVFLNRRLKTDGIAVIFYRPQKKVWGLLHNFFLDKVLTISEDFELPDTPRVQVD
jgi:anti-anti-sigma factor